MFSTLSDYLNSAAFLHWMLAIGLTLLVLDVFINTELLSWISLLVFAAWGTWMLGLPIQWSVLVFLAFLGLAAAVYYTLWNHVIRRLAAGYLLRKAPAEAMEELKGKRGTIIGAGEQLCVRCGDQLFPVAEVCRASFKAGDVVCIEGIEGAHAIIKPM